MKRTSPFTPLFFSPSRDESGWGWHGMQVFANTDRIFIEVIASSDDTEPSLRLHDICDGTSQSLEWIVFNLNAETVVYYYYKNIADCGIYKFSIDGKDSNVFRVTDDEGELSMTTLVQCAMKDNRQRTDVITWLAGRQHYFSFRVQGGFKDDGWTFGVEDEQFVTQQEDRIGISAREYTQKVFTLGHADGVPVWFAQLLNRMLSMSYVYFDGVRYTRNDGAVPEQQQTIEGQRSYIYNVTLQEVVYNETGVDYGAELNVRFFSSGVSPRFTSGTTIRQV